MQEHEKPWKPLAVDEVSVLFAGAPFPWWIAGGLALELAIGDPVREHSDIDVLILRRDHAAVREWLGQWDCWAADPPGQLRPWKSPESLPPEVHDIWCRRYSEDSWRLQLMIDESDAGSWVSRRDNRIHAPIQEITRLTRTGVRYLAPHIQLFYKAKSPRKKDEVDFIAVTNSGIDIDAVWLSDAITRCYGHQHPWLKRLPQ